jgi:hypothetical protein
MCDRCAATGASACQTGLDGAPIYLAEVGPYLPEKALTNQRKKSQNKKQHHYLLKPIAKDLLFFKFIRNILVVRNKIHPGRSRRNRDLIAISIVKMNMYYHFYQ